MGHGKDKLDDEFEKYWLPQSSISNNPGGRHGGSLDCCYRSRVPFPSQSYFPRATFFSTYGLSKFRLHAPIIRHAGHPHSAGKTWLAIRQH